MLKEGKRLQEKGSIITGLYKIQRNYDNSRFIESRSSD